MHWRLPTEHVASGPFSSDERLKPAPVGSATGANRPYGVSSAPRTTEPLTSAEVAQLYWDPRELIGFTERSTTTLTQLQAKPERTREREWATDEGEVHPTVLGLAALVPGRGSGEHLSASAFPSFTPPAPNLRSHQCRPRREVRAITVLDPNRAYVPDGGPTW